MDANDALARLKRDLSRAWLASPDLIAQLAISSADPTHCGEFEIRSVFVERAVENVEEPLSREPSTPSQPFDAWTTHWPPTAEQSLVSTKIDVRESYEVLVCAACAQAGETMCGVCRGSGKVADPKTNRATRCDTCKGKGTVTCSRCCGRGKLLRFKRINQRVKAAIEKIRLPTGMSIPTGSTSGDLHYAEGTPTSSADVATTSLRGAAPKLDAMGWLSLLGQRFATAERPKGMAEASRRMAHYSGTLV